MDDALTPRQVADELGVSIRTVQRWIGDGRLPGERIGGRLRVRRASLRRVAAEEVAHRTPRTNASAAAARRAGQIGSLLIANRGEIAARIARTARRLGIRVIGVHADDERGPAGVDEARRIGSYLDAEELLAVATSTGADAIHPGYGFLAENAGFALAVQEAGLVWVGPPPGAISAMGDKAEARRIVAARGVPVVPGYDGADQDDRALAREARRIGYPLLVKPSAGGGGKGMRVVRDPGALPEELATARREAARAFGDDHVILERLVERARHVEIQVLFDAHGRGVHLGERDCSAQRRSQKIVEEAPGPAVGPELREQMGAAALAAAASVEYVNAGTVEFLLTDDGDFYFIEMNTRLQVEHPVTEAVTGRDLVADQLRIAAGESLGIVQGDVELLGHAIEARIYAEDPGAGFLPATGRILALEWPRQPGIRVDAGVVLGDVVGDRYDPMLAKVVAHGADRTDALSRLAEALNTTRVLGVRTNLHFLRWLLAGEPMRAGEVRTDTIGDLPPLSPSAPSEAHWEVAARRLGPASRTAAMVWSDGWRLNAPPVRRVRCGGEERSVRLGDPREPSGSAAAAEPAAVRDGEAVHVDVDGQSLEFRLAPPATVEEATRRAAVHGGAGTSTLVAPMPGRVVAVRVDAGAAVEAHAALVVIEAMKMEHAVVSPVAGVVDRVSVREGQQVERGEVLAEVTPYHLDDV